MIGRTTLFASLASLLVVTHADADAGFVLVVNKANPVASLTPSTLKRLCTGVTKTWDGGSVVQLGIIAADTPETKFLATTLDTTPREMLSLIQQQIFKGELRRPVALRSSAECVALAASNPGAICVAAAGTPIAAGARAVPLK